MVDSVLTHHGNIIPYGSYSSAHTAYGVTARSTQHKQPTNQNQYYTNDTFSFSLPHYALPFHRNNPDRKFRQTKSTTAMLINNKPTSWVKLFNALSTLSAPFYCSIRSSDMGYGHTIKLYRVLHGVIIIIVPHRFGFLQAPHCRDMLTFIVVSSDNNMQPCVGIVYPLPYVVHRPILWWA